MANLSKIQTMNKTLILSILFFLFLVLFFVQPTILNDLFQTMAGRAFLVLSLIYITYCNQIVGLFFVLSLIVVYISWDTNEPSYLEGLGTMSPGLSTINNPPRASTGRLNTVNNIPQGSSLSRGPYLSRGPALSPGPSLSPGPALSPVPALSPSPSTVNNPPPTKPFNQTKLFNMLSYISANLDSIKNLLASNQESSSNANKQNSTKTNGYFNLTNPFNVGLEGFDVLGLEDNMKKGKQSNSIVIESDQYSSNSVMPYEEDTIM
jgi:hypothetical protein